jgi:integrase
MARIGPRTDLTEVIVKSLEWTPDGPKHVVDAQVPQLHLMLGQTKKSWRYWITAQGNVHQGVFGRWPEMPVKAARLEVLRRITELTSSPVAANARVPLEDKPLEAITLADIFPLQRAVWKDHSRSPKRLTEANGEVNWARLAPLHDETLVKLAEKPSLIRQWHVDARDKGRKPERPDGYAASADNSLILLATMWGIARSTLPQCRVLPEFSMLKIRRFDLPSRKFDVSESAILRHWNAIRTVPHRFPQVELAWRVAFFAPLRKQELLTARWEHVDQAERKWRVPAPKGGIHRAYDLPICAQADRYLVQLRKVVDAIDPKCPWLFPHTQDPKKPLPDLRPTVAVGFQSAHYNRHVWRTVADELEIRDLTAARLLNHKDSSVVGSVEATYIGRRWKPLLKAAQQIGDHLDQLIKSERSAEMANPLFEPEY